MVNWRSACHHCEKPSDDTDDTMLRTFQAVTTVITGKIEMMTLANNGKNSQISRLDHLSSLSSLSSLEFGNSAKTREIMKAFLDKWSVKVIETAADGNNNKAVEFNPELEPESLHYVLRGKAILGEMLIQSCEVGCGTRVKFYYQDGIGYGYCSRCGVHQRINKVQ